MRHLAGQEFVAHDVEGLVIEQVDSAMGLELGSVDLEGHQHRVATGNDEVESLTVHQFDQG
jgi:hypothetical protein